MDVRDILGYFLAAVGLIFLGAVISRLDLWSAVCNWTVPWFCSAVALGLLIMLSMSVVSGMALSEMKLAWVLLIYLLILVLGAVGIAVDDCSMARQCASGMCHLEADIYDAVRKQSADRYMQNLLEWLSFSAILGVLLIVGRCKKSGKSEETPK